MNRLWIYFLDLLHLFLALHLDHVIGRSVRWVRLVALLAKTLRTEKPQLRVVLFYAALYTEQVL